MMPVSISSTMPRAYEQGNAEIVMGEALKQLKMGPLHLCGFVEGFLGRLEADAKGLSAKHVTDGAHQALKRLQVDYLDLYFCHRPDIDTPIEETVRAMHNLSRGQGNLLGHLGMGPPSSSPKPMPLPRANNLTPPTWNSRNNICSAAKRSSRVSAAVRPAWPRHDDLVAARLGILTGKYNNGIPGQSHRPPRI